MVFFRRESEVYRDEWAVSGKLSERFEIKIPIVKLYAILNRGRIMGRDLYDASHLFGITEPDMNYLEQKVQVSSRKKIEELIVNHLGEISIDDLARDVEPFVPGRNDLLRVKLFPEILRNWAGAE